MKPRLLLFAGLIAALIFGTEGCRAPYSYLPNAPNMPMLTEEGQKSLTIYPGANRIEVQGAYSYKEGQALTGNVYADTRGRVFLEGGAGLYKKLSDYTNFELYGGYGWGLIKKDYFNEDPVIFTAAKDGEYHHVVNTSYQRLFIQPGLSGVFGFDETVGLAVRAGVVHFPNYDFESVFNGNDGTFDFTADSDTVKVRNAIAAMFDPTVVYQRNWGNFSLRGQAAYSFSFSNLEGQTYVHPVFNRFTANIGVRFLIPGKEKDSTSSSRKKKRRRRR